MMNFSEHNTSQQEEKANLCSSIECTQEQEAESPKEEPKKNTHEIKRDPKFEEFVQSLEALPDVEAKLQHATEFMEAALSAGTSPRFKHFWDARTLCLEFFKETISPVLRATLWTKYTDLSKEAKRLKDLLDEQSAFAVEQIDIAIKALEQEVTTPSLKPFQFSLLPRSIQPHTQQYETMQGEVHFLNTHVSRINSMRKELIKTEMRVRQKNQFFERLSLLGDKVFPRRKELIKEISALFVKDVDTFITSEFKQDTLHHPLFALREEIKALQNMAKELTLNTHAFTHTRLALSECWDKVKHEDKERKKDRLQLKEVWKQNFETCTEKLEAFKQMYEANAPTPADATAELDKLVREIREMQHGSIELNELKATVKTLRKAIQGKLEAEQAEKTHLAQEKEEKRRQAIACLRGEIEELKKSVASQQADDLEEKRQELVAKVEALEIHKLEKQEIERSLRSLRDTISEKKEDSLLALTEEDRASLGQLKEILQQKKERRLESKRQLDQLKRNSGASGLDFEQAININAQITAERERLEKINEGIDEIEAKIRRITS